MKIADVNFTKSKALPAAGASASTDSLDLGAATAGPLGHALEMHIEVEACPNLVEDKDIDIELEHSADDETFVPVPGTGNFQVTGGTGNGAPATSFRFYLPPDTLQYIRATASVETGGGTNTASAFTLRGRV